jgi:hypothetical protein
MIQKNKITKRSRNAWSLINLDIKTVVISALILTGIQAPLQAQETQYTKPSWYFGVAGGANFNFFRGSTQQMNSAFTSPVAFHDGDGVGLFVAPLLEYRPADSRWGLMLQTSYDSRKGSFDQVTTPCNCPADLKTKLSYITVEPSLRFAPFKSGLYLYGGPRVGFNINKSFTYQLGTNPTLPNQLTNPEVKGDFSNVRETIISM